MSPDTSSDRPVESRFFEWTFPGAPVRIQLSLDLVRALREHLGGAALRRDQVGGILLGSAKLTRVEITGFEPFPCTPREDGKFVISGSDRSRFASVVRRYSSPVAPAEAVGYYRTGTGLRLYSEDLNLIHEFFTDPTSAFLVIRPEAGDATPTAGFFFWDGAEVFAGSTYMPFPFDERMLAAETGAGLPVTRPAHNGTPEPAAAAPPAPQETAAAAPFGPPVPPVAPVEETALPPPLPPPESHPPPAQVPPPAVESASVPRAAPRTIELQLTRKRMLIGAAALCALILLLTLPALFRSKPGASPRAGEVRGAADLAVSRSGADVTISWDANSPAVQNARSGSLTIQDGQGRRDLPLSPSMLRSSRIVYTPATDTLQVTLELDTPRGPLREAVFYMGSQGSAAAANAAIGSAPGPLAASRPRAAAPPPRQSAARSAPAETSPPAPQRPLTAARRKTEAPHGVPAPLAEAAHAVFTPAAPPVATATPVIPPPAPVAQPADVLARSGPELPAAAPLPQPQQPEAPAAPPVETAPPPARTAAPSRSAPEPAPTDSVPRPTRAAPARPAPPPARAAAPSRSAPPPVPPKPLRQVLPELPPNVRGMLSEEVGVRVKVKVDASGKVTAAQALGGNGAVASYLAKAAESAARVWRFEPARLDGRAVPGELTIEFRFAPEKRR